MNKEKSIKVKCTREDCSHEWNYKGNSKFYITCPRCYGKINLTKAIKLAGDKNE